MLKPRRSRQFKTDYKKVARAKDILKLDEIIVKLCSQIKLDEKHQDHDLHYNWEGHRECHIEPNWLLVYKFEDNSIVFVRTGSHSEIFS